ncbi:transposase, partial [Myroides odoratimimus]|uniref:transposase n=1 Tax=Myroides odoratimimus TaxID=76832 RepID=UPI000563CF40
DKKAVAADLKPIYTAVSEEQGYERLLQFEEKWAKNYPLAAKGWLDNWEHLSTYFDFDPHIRKAIYTTKTVAKGYLFEIACFSIGKTGYFVQYVLC